MAQYQYDRHVRTPYSEGYEIREGEQRLGHLDLHYASQEVYATLILERELDEDGILELIERIDDDLVLSAEMPREDFLVNVYHGRDVGLYNDDFMRERHSEDGHST
ncbi:MAG TPA: hypothetical protein VFB34_02580 [Chloroflexota bacterium]|nr:hypothetical protein [Chloroflexota bacterium]